jgi:hypothetical protein
MHWMDLDSTTGLVLMARQLIITQALHLTIPQAQVNNTCHNKTKKESYHS